MNDYPNYLRRHAANLIERALEVSPVVVVMEYPDLFRGGLLLHSGTEIQWLSKGILAVPWHRVI